MPDIHAPGPGRPFAIVHRTGESALEDLSRESVDAMLREHGAVLIRGFPPDLDAFRHFSSRFCDHWVVNEVPNRGMLDPTHDIQSVDLGKKTFPFHSEISRAPWRPDVCFFYCMKPPSSGGETLICDGVAVARALPAEVRDGLAPLRLVYTERARRSELAYWLGTETPSPTQLTSPPADCPFLFVRGQRGIFRIFSRPALHKPLFGDAPAFANFLLFARDMRGTRAYPTLSDGRPVPDEWVDAIRQTCAQLAAPVTWDEGDLLILDNSRFMHGRNAITDPDARIIASRFGYLKNAPTNPEEPANPIWRREAFIPPGYSAE